MSKRRGRAKWRTRPYNEGAKGNFDPERAQRMEHALAIRHGVTRVPEITPPPKRKKK